MQCVLQHTSLLLPAGHKQTCKTWRVGAGKSQTIVMKDINVGTVELLLQYMYGCLQPDVTLPEIVALFQASDQYAIASLHQQCTRLLTAHISFDSIFELADLAQLHHCPSLLQVHPAALSSLLG